MDLGGECSPHLGSSHPDLAVGCRRGPGTCHWSSLSPPCPTPCSSAPVHQWPSRHAAAALGSGLTEAMEARRPFPRAPPSLSPLGDEPCVSTLVFLKAPTFPPNQGFLKAPP